MSDISQSPKPISPKLESLIESFVNSLRDQVLPSDDILQRATPRWEYRRCNSATCYQCHHQHSPSRMKGHGPYLYLYWKEKGKLRKKYMGKDPENYFSNKLEQYYR
jgi:hypothetical protein